MKLQMCGRDSECAAEFVECPVFQVIMFFSEFLGTTEFLKRLVFPDFRVSRPPRYVRFFRISDFILFLYDLYDFHMIL